MTNQDDNLMNINYTYPSNDDENLQYKIYKKREFYSHKLTERPVIQITLICSPSLAKCSLQMLSV